MEYTRSLDYICAFVWIKFYQLMFLFKQVKILCTMKCSSYCHAVRFKAQEHDSSVFWINTPFFMSFWWTVQEILCTYGWNGVINSVKQKRQSYLTKAAGGTVVSCHSDGTACWRHSPGCDVPQYSHSQPLSGWSGHSHGVLVLSVTGVKEYAHVTTYHSLTSDVQSSQLLQAQLWSFKTI
jgi:hypothetical protein